MRHANETWFKAPTLIFIAYRLEKYVRKLIKTLLHSACSLGKRKIFFSELISRFFSASLQDRLTGHGGGSSPFSAPSHHHHHHRTNTVSGGNTTMAPHHSTDFQPPYFPPPFPPPHHQAASPTTAQSHHQLDYLNSVTVSPFFKGQCFFFCPPPSLPRSQDFATRNLIFFCLSLLGNRSLFTNIKFSSSNCSSCSSGSSLQSIDRGCRITEDDTRRPQEGWRFAARGECNFLLFNSSADKRYDAITVIEVITWNVWRYWFNFPDVF